MPNGSSKYVGALRVESRDPFDNSRIQIKWCPSKVQDKQTFVDHACDTHPTCVHYLNTIRDGSLTGVVCPWILEVAQNIKIENDFDNKLAQKLPKSVSILRTQAAPTKIEIQHEPAKENNDKNFDSSNEDFEDFDNDEDYDPDQGSLLKGTDNKTVRT